MEERFYVKQQTGARRTKDSPGMEAIRRFSCKTRRATQFQVIASEEEAGAG